MRDSAQQCDGMQRVLWHAHIDSGPASDHVFGSGHGVCLTLWGGDGHEGQKWGSPIPGFESSKIGALDAGLHRVAIVTQQALGPTNYRIQGFERTFAAANVVVGP